MDQALAKAGEEEVQEKGKVWNTVYSEPKEYTFPNYTFQTGPRKGMNHSIGRSSWEPMLEAYADVVNKRMADRISARTNINEEEKIKRIQEQRIELLYEKFKFPVDIRVNEKGEERPVIYILDFIDINRWRAIEVKGPLTQKGAEKIRLFQKYYVDGDFSDLPEEKKIIMMKYVEDKKSEVREWCEERGYPVFDHFSSLEVLGAYKWDHDLNNFNRYTEAKNMAGLSDREKEQLQKGFFKLVEDRIATGKTPDIRPEKYTNTDKLPEIIKFNQKEAKAQKNPYVVENPISTKLYLPEAMIHEIIENYQKQNGRSLSIFVEQAVLDTISISPYKKDVIMTTTLLRGVLEDIDGVISENVQNLSSQDYEEIRSGRKVGLAPLPNITKKTIDNLLRGLISFSEYLARLGKIGVDLHDRKHIDKIDKDVPKFIKRLITLYKDRFKFAGQMSYMTIDKNYLEGSEKIQSVSFLDVLVFHEHLLLGEYISLHNRRFNKIDSLTATRLASNTDYIEKARRELETSRERPFTKESSERKYKIVEKIIILTLAEEKIMTGDIFCAFIVANKFVWDIGLKVDNLLVMLYSIEEKFANLEKASQFFASRSDDRNAATVYLETLNHLRSSMHNNPTGLFDDQQRLKEHMYKNRENIAQMAEILLKDELGEEVFNRINEKFNEKYLRYTQKQAA